MHVFAYGSLLWRPGFSPASATPALLEGWRRSWCVDSTLHRGTPQQPGLVLGLVEGGSCCGVLYEVKAGEEELVRRYLDEREMAEAGYVPATVLVRAARGAVEALTYLADPERCDVLDPAQTLARISSAAGSSGSNLDYVLQTLAALAGLPVDLVQAGESGLCATILSTLRFSGDISSRISYEREAEPA